MISKLANPRTLTWAAVILVAPACALAQTNYAAEAAKNPAAASRPTPRMADGHPDLNGVWHHFFGIGTIEKVGDSFVVGGAFSPKSGALYNAPLNDAKPEYKTRKARRQGEIALRQSGYRKIRHCIACLRASRAWDLPTRSCRLLNRRSFSTGTAPAINGA